MFEEAEAESVESEPASGPPPQSFVPVHLQVYGDANSEDLQQLVNCVQLLYQQRPAFFLRAPEIFPQHEAEWTTFVDNLRKMLQGGELWCLDTLAVLFCDTQYVGGPEQALDWITETFNVTFDLDDLEQRGNIYQEMLVTRQHSMVYLDFSHDGQMLGRLVFELYDELLPRTCENFRQLCGGQLGLSVAGTVLWYAGTPVHRIVRGGWLQAGDIVDGCGAHGESVFGRRFADECYAVPHDRRGRLAMVQDERNHNASQFMVAFQPMTYMQYMSCAFGQLVEGSAVLDYLEMVETNNERPVKTVGITNGGVLYKPEGKRSGQSVGATDFQMVEAGGEQSRPSVRATDSQLTEAGEGQSRPSVRATDSQLTEA
ncbi:probable inactive peptidyl-prolyl cis-trans isomerase-like 6, partial [Pollicipes pollicipes]|uniref:probable inactive peptidyl-prolyl cis-trans isomerase-like 6 n=1 Tax=Pollicipes pollicipes TaxID=41117 RepID=UPI0018854162